MNINTSPLVQLLWYIAIIWNLSKTQSMPSTVYLGTTTATSDESKAKLFNLYFHSVFNKASQPIPEYIIEWFPELIYHYQGWCPWGSDSTWYRETSLIRPPSGPTVSGLVNEVVLLLKTSLMQPFNKLALLLRFQKVNSYKSIYWTLLSFIIYS